MEKESIEITEKKLDGVQSVKNLRGKEKRTIKFKISLFGFDRKQVQEYIAQTSDIAANKESLSEEQIVSLKRSNIETQNKLSKTIEELESYGAKLAASKRETEEARTDAESLRQRVTQLLQEEEEIKTTAYVEKEDLSAAMSAKEELCKQYHEQTQSAMEQLQKVLDKKEECRKTAAEVAKSVGELKKENDNLIRENKELQSRLNIGDYNENGKQSEIIKRIFFTSNNLANGNVDTAEKELDALLADTKK